ncbi:MAG: HNH endonuclease [Chitinophagales bacterium]|nr:HNH endonuclease [Chitinophagales bacterium]
MGQNPCPLYIAGRDDLSNYRSICRDCHKTHSLIG